MRYVLLLALLATASPAAIPDRTSVPRSLVNAEAVRLMLAPDTWARLVRLENARAGTWSSSRYPRTVYGLVFELSGILWFYTDTDGTQSLSRTKGTLERDKADPGPLFRAIEPGITAWEWIDDPKIGRPTALREPPNACFEESVRAFDLRVATGGTTQEPRLLFYYVDVPGGRLGHTVLLFGEGKELYAIDAQQSASPQAVPLRNAGNIVSIASYLRGGPVASARTLALDPVRAPHGERWAALPGNVPGPG